MWFNRQFDTLGCLLALVLLVCLGFPIAAGSQTPSLAKTFEGKFRFGFGGTHDQTVRAELNKPGSPIGRIVESHSNIIGINCFYAASIRPNANTWRWDHCDQLLAFAEQHPQWPRRAHVAFWPFQKNPGLNLEWLLKGKNDQPVSRDEAIHRLRQHINVVIGRYRGRFQYWDVVNEVIDQQQPDGIRKGLWKETIGPEVVEIAFQAAREADPAAKLFYNDFNEWVPAKRELIFELVRKLKDKGLIDGIGLQGHYNMNSPTVRELDEAIGRYAQLGLEIHITELDVEVNKNGKINEFTTELAQAQSKRYRDVFDVYLKHAGTITAVMTWNVTDNTSWLRNHPTPHSTWPLLFDGEGEPKAAFWALVKPSMK